MRGEVWANRFSIFPSFERKFRPTFGFFFTKLILSWYISVRFVLTVASFSSSLVVPFFERFSTFYQRLDQFETYGSNTVTAKAKVIARIRIEKPSTR